MLSGHNIQVYCVFLSHYVMTCEVSHMYFWFIDGEGLEIESANVQYSNIIFAATCI